MRLKKMNDLLFGSVNVDIIDISLHNLLGVKPLSLWTEDISVSCNLDKHLFMNFYDSLLVKVIMSSFETFTIS